MTTETDRKLSIFVRGTPAPKGSVSAFGFQRKDGGQGAAVTHSRSSKEWERQVKAVLQTEWEGAPLEGAISVELYFSLLKPKSVSKKRLWPTVKPDVDKLARAVLDALKGIAYHDDSQVTDLVVQKRYWPEAGVRVLVQHTRSLN